MTIRQRAARLLVCCTIAGTFAVATQFDGVGATPARPALAAATADPIAVAAAQALQALDTPTFTTALETAAYAAAAPLGADGARLYNAWSSADRVHQVALLSALTQIGVRYHRNTSQEGVGFDCSGLTTFAWAQSGVGLQRQSGAQIRSAAPRTWETAQAGDLVYYPGHVTMWLGVDDLIVHAPNSGRTVEVAAISHRRLARVKIGNPAG